MEGISRVQFY